MKRKILMMINKSKISSSNIKKKQFWNRLMKMRISIVMQFRSMNKSIKKKKRYLKMSRIFRKKLKRNSNSFIMMIIEVKLDKLIKLQ
jgi:hypothetical protein